MNEIQIDLQSGTTRIVLLALSVLMIALPFFTVTYVPSADIPQHLSQIQLYHAAAGNPDSEYSVRLFGANLMIYWLMLLLWWIVPPVLTGKLTMLLLATSWIISIFALAKSEQRPPVAAVIASLFVFNSSLYWGFINFLSGFPVMTLWYLFVVRKNKEQFTPSFILLSVLLSLLLFFAHSLWLAVALMIALIADINAKVGLKKIALHALTLIPVGVAALLWFPMLATSRAAQGFDTSAHWLVSPLERFNPQWMVNAMFGGLPGPAEWIVAAGVIAWIILSLTTNRKELWGQINKNFFFSSLFLFILVFALPDKYINTISFAARWMPAAMIFLVLSLPHPRISQVMMLLAPLLLLIIFSVTTTLAWTRFNDVDQDGLTEVLDNVPENVRVLGLDYVKKSKYIGGRPFIQTFAYAQALHGGELNFSFAEHVSGIVVPKVIEMAPKWTPGLEWIPEYVMYEDIQKFDYVIMNATDEFHRLFLSITPLTPVTDSGMWRLYKVNADDHKGFVIAF